MIHANLHQQKNKNKYGALAGLEKTYLPTLKKNQQLTHCRSPTLPTSWCNVSIPPPRHQTIIHRPSVVNHVGSHVITSHGHDNQSKSFLISIKELTDK